MLDVSARERPDELAVDDGVRTRSFAELHDRSVRVARLLREDFGLEPDDHVAVLMHNRVEYVELIVGAIMAGVWITPVNWHLSEGEIEYVLADSGARVLFCDAHHEALGTAALAEAGHDGQLVRVGDDLDARLVAASDQAMPADAPAGGNMIYTSGTTGRPKGVKRARPATLGAAMENLGVLGRNVGLDGSGPHLITGPMYHAAPLMFAIYDNANGAPILIMPRFEERALLRLIDERRVAHTHLVPTMFVRLLRLPEEEKSSFDGSSLSLVLHGAAPVSVAVKHRMIEWWGEVLLEYWGATEGGVNTLVDSADWLAHPGTVGRALPAFEVFAVDEQGRRLPKGEVGDLYCRHKTQDVVFEYHGDAEKTASAYLEPGVFTIGDIGSVDHEGYVYLADRKSAMIISGGVNIYPMEVEQVLAEHPAVADVGVFGIPDEEWGEQIKAAIELAVGFAPSPTLEREILDFAREHLAGYKVPRSIDFEERLPREASGKLYKRRLREPYWAGRERRI